MEVMGCIFSNITSKISSLRYFDQFHAEAVCCTCRSTRWYVSCRLSASSKCRCVPWMRWGQVSLSRRAFSATQERTVSIILISSINDWIFSRKEFQRFSYFCKIHFQDCLKFLTKIFFTKKALTRSSGFVKWDL